MLDPQQSYRQDGRHPAAAAAATAAAAAIAATAATAAAAAAANANLPAGPNIAQALTDHEHVKRSMDMPLFFGCKEIDSITACHLIERVERAATIANWDAKHKCTEVYMILCDKAIVWYESLQDDDLDLEDWDVIKKEFLKAYEPKYSARTTCAKFADLSQKPGKTVKDYHVRVQMAYKRLTDNKPTTMAAAWNAAATVAEAKLEEMNDMAKLFKHQLFLPCLTGQIRDKILEARKDAFAQSLELAREFEAIQLNHKRTLKIGAVKA
jgi:hypothetical protein